jgi:hypothetical protein
MRVLATHLLFAFSFFPSLPPSLTHSLTHSLTPSLPQDLAIRLLPYRVDSGAQSYKQVEEGQEIDWGALAKGRHVYKERLERGEVTALPTGSVPVASYKATAAAA